MEDLTKARTTRISREPTMDKKRSREQKEGAPLSVENLPSVVKIIGGPTGQDHDDSALEFRIQTRAMSCTGGKRCVNAKQKRSEH